jgi:signal transduction histidine kinase
VRIEICDNGEGIDPEVRERLFEPFFTTRTKGTGLGLAIVCQIAELHGGAVELKDNRPCGTCVVLTLPQTPAMVNETQGQDDAMKQGQTA